MKKRKIILISCLAILLLVLSIVLGYTYAKYATTVEVTGVGKVATWNFSGAISNTSDVQTKSINLASTLDKASIKSGKIAPGTSGDFKIIIDATGSEVDVDYDVVLGEEGSQKPRNLYFTCDDLLNGKGEKFYSLEKLLKVDEDSQRSNMSGTIPVNSESGSKKTITVHWEWPYETTIDGKLQDVEDTEDSSLEDYTFSINIIGKQVRP